jgi:hypothetical protein
MRHLASTFALALAVSACSDRAKQAAADSDLARDIALANQAPANPQFQDTALGAAPETHSAKRSARTPPARVPTRRSSAPRRAPTTVERPRPSKPAPGAPAPGEPPAAAPAPAPRAKGFQSGTSFGLVTKSQVCTTNLPGDKFVATITEPVRGDNGAMLPAGTTVVIEVASVIPGDTPEQAQISLRVRSIDLNDEAIGMEGNVAIASPLERRQVPRDKNSDRRKVVAGAVAGAVIGQIMGKDTKSTVIGAAAGAAAGTAAAMAGRKYDACLPAGASLRVTTSQPITISD